MEKSDLEEINYIINKRTKTILDGIEMLNEEIMDFKKTAYWTYLFLLLAIVINIGFSAI